MTEAEIRAVVIEFARLQRGGRLGKKYIRDNKNTPATHGYDRDHAGVGEPELRDAVPRIALLFPAYGGLLITAEINRQSWTADHKRVGRIPRVDNLQLSSEEEV